MGKLFLITLKYKSEKCSYTRQEQWISFLKLNTHKKILFKKNLKYNSPLKNYKTSVYHMELFTNSNYIMKA